MSTPIFDGMMAEQNFKPAKLGYKVSFVKPWPPEETLIVTSTPEPTWRTFIRCLGWWKK